MGTQDTIGRLVAGATVERQALEQRFERMMREHGGSVLRIASAYEIDAATRDDLVQEIALALWKALPTFREECSERTLAFRIAQNRALTHISRRRPLSELDREIADPRATPESAASAGQLRERLLAAVQKLAVGHRQVIVLLLEGMTHGEIAEVLGIAKGNVAVRVSRARKELRELMGEPR